ncbi:DUF58 domain-containing protein [uncultured Croceicoccus sp.]|uniref:DUF58 domain-containing protein n=1 Tax=uncultured Croceicoccus sp. TaxID=1295329 RepID=UPI00262DCDFE|nr:DUF58 domain-containing protein [uncultured Croceicoccus sp.]
MIYPTRRALIAAAAGLPLALCIAVLWPGVWAAGLLWPVAVAALVAIDAIMAPSRRTLSVDVDMPETVSVGHAFDAVVTLRFAGKAPDTVELSLGLPQHAEAVDGASRTLTPLAGEASAAFALRPQRRGLIAGRRVWLRWTGPMGLCWKQMVHHTDGETAVLPDIETARRNGPRMFDRIQHNGMVTQMLRGEGSDFDSLVEFRPGMDRRAIDWKHSARHHALHAREYRTERNNQIVFAIDAGRQMTDPVAGMPRIDRAVSAALLNAWLALRLGDRVAFFGFDARPRVTSGFVGGPSAFAQLQQVAARIDYSAQETNYTLALSELSGRVHRRSLIVLMTEFTDAIAAGFLLRSAAQIMRRHVLMVVVLRDEELESMAGARPDTADDIARAVTADALLRERLLVLTQLRQLGVEVVEAGHENVAERLVEAYLVMKRENRL